MATSCFHPSSSLEAVTLVNGPLPSFSNTLSRSFPVFSSMHHQHHFPLSVLFVVVFSSSLPTSFPSLSVALSSCLFHQSLRILYQCYFCFSYCSLNRSHISLPFPHISPKDKNPYLTSATCSAPRVTLVPAPFFFHPFLRCFHLGFRLSSLLEYLFLDAYLLFVLRPGPALYSRFICSSSLMLKTAMGHHARLCSSYQEPLFLEVP